jgi:hypothetical protein
VTVALCEALVTADGGRVDGQDPHLFDEAGRVRVLPDIVWKTGGTAVAVADAKYKAEKPAGYPNADLYQLLAYCTALGLRCGHLIYARGLRSRRITWCARPASRSSATLSTSIPNRHRCWHRYAVWPGGSRRSRVGWWRHDGQNRPGTRQRSRGHQAARGPSSALSRRPSCRPNWSAGGSHATGWPSSWLPDIR